MPCVTAIEMLDSYSGLTLDALVTCVSFDPALLSSYSPSLMYIHTLGMRFAE